LLLKAAKTLLTLAHLHSYNRYLFILAIKTITQTKVFGGLGADSCEWGNAKGCRRADKIIYKYR